MPQQLKQFVENSKKQKEYKNYDYQNIAEPQNYEKSGTETEAYDAELDFGKHFLTFTNSNISSEDELQKTEEQEKEKSGETKKEDGNTAIDMSVHE